MTKQQDGYGMFFLKIIWLRTGSVLLLAVEIFDYYKDFYFVVSFPHTQDMVFFLWFSVTVPYLASCFFNGGFFEGAKSFFSFGFLFKKDEEYYTKRLNALFFIALFQNMIQILCQFNNLF